MRAAAGGGPGEEVAGEEKSCVDTEGFEVFMRGEKTFWVCAGENGVRLGGVGWGLGCCDAIDLKATPTNSVIFDGV